VARSAVRIEGRDEEVARLLAVSRSSHARGDRAMLLSGDAGIGKTHLARAVAEQLAGDGHVVAWGRADPVERAVPYAAISQALASLPGGHRLALDETRRGDDLLRTDVHRPVAELLEAHCAAGPVAVVIDDLHHADEDTLVLIGFLVRRLADVPLTWIFTSRRHVAESTPGLAALLHRLTEDGRLEEIALDRLPDDDIARLAEAAVGRPLAAPARTVVVERSAGNPFFAIQLALSLAEGGVLDDPIGVARAVPTISRRVALLERVFPLGERARSVARLVSVLGDIDLDRLEGLASVLGVDLAEVQDGFDRLVRADLLRPVDELRYEFVHDLVRETLYGDLGPAERRRLHGAAARVLLERRAHGDHIDLVELAHHLSLGSPGPDAAAVDALREAGDLLARSSPRSAAVRYRRAIEYLPAGGDGAGDLHVRLARALHRAGEPREVVRVCRSGLADASGDVRDRLTRYLSAALADEGELGAALAIVDRELGDRGDAAVLLTTRALLNRMLEHYEAAATDVERADAVARTGPERLAVLFQRLNLFVDRGAAAGDGPTLLADLEAMLPSLDPETRRMAHVHAAGTCAALGEIHRGAAHIRAADALDAQGVADVDWPWTFASRIAIDVAQGRWDDALRTYEEGAPEFTAGLRLTARNHATTPIGDVALARHDLDRLQRLAADVSTLTAHGKRLKVLAESKLLGLQGKLGEAMTALEAALEDVPPGSYLESYLLLGVGSTMLLAGGPGAARDVLDRVLASARAIGTAWSEMLGDLIELMICDDAEAGRTGLDAALRLGHLRYEPDFRLHLGRVGVDPDTNLPAALQMFTELGSVDSIEATVTEMRRRGLRVPTRRRGDRFALTDAEQRVAELVAGGLSNRAIADRLAYSVKTIEAYLSRIYVKTGCRNRVDLTRRFTVPVS
jgi:DNA-binding CsgD family transcriptional regulator